LSLHLSTVTSSSRFSSSSCRCLQNSSASEAAEKPLSEGVILSKAKDLLFVLAEKKADPSIAQNRRDLRMTPPASFSAAC
jgi:hypothetical protein